ncbi:hypothetical protein [Haloarchaeobius sp. TZWWS8]|uniref:hypothetical protein n=1 Tax=Haloarchaeobius sp. TZWWS8 TaxID=3446121 RepID=UPI003EBB6733
MPAEDTTTQVTVKISDRKKQRINEIAIGETEVGNRVTSSDVIREAVEDYIAKYDAQPENCQPSERGKLGCSNEEGAA